MYIACFSVSFYTNFPLPVAGACQWIRSRVLGMHERAVYTPPTMSKNPSSASTGYPGGAQAYPPSDYPAGAYPGGVYPQPSSYAGSSSYANSTSGAAMYPPQTQSAGNYPPNGSASVGNYSPQMNAAYGHSAYSQNYHSQNTGKPNAPSQPQHAPPSYGNVMVVVSEPAEAEYVSQAESSVRRGFIRKVYSILSIQLLVTASVVIGFTFDKVFARTVQATPGVLFVSLIGSFVLLIALSCFPAVARKYPGNVICLSLFTIFESILVGSIASTYTTDSVIKAVAGE